MANCFFCYQDAGGQAYHSKCCKKFFGTTTLPVLEIDNNKLKELATLSINQRISVTGAQPKLSVSLEKVKQENRLTIVGLWGEYILKPPHPEFAWMVETEDLTMHLAEVFGIPVCEHAIIPDVEGNLVYLVKRFDRVKGKKVHVEDLCQLSEFLTENKYKGSYEKAGKIIRKFCAAGIDALTYFEVVLFSFLTGNNDMHLKNFSLVHVPSGPRFSPAYDLLNVHLVFPEDKEELALTLNGKKSKIRWKDFEMLSNVLGLNEKVLANTKEKFFKKNKLVFALIEQSFLPDEQKDRYKEIWLQKQNALER
jgi:serine/threonine-protein kinase HipA